MNKLPLNLLAGICVSLCWSATTAMAAQQASHAQVTHSVHQVDATGHAFRVDDLGRRLPIARSVLAPLPGPQGSTPANWTALGPPGADVAVVAASPDTPGLVFAGVAPGGQWGGSLYQSTDDGATWSQVPALVGESVFDIQFAPGGKIYLAVQDGIQESDDNGATWAALNLNIGLNDQVFALAVDPSDPSTIWAGITDALASQPVNLMRSSDGGMTWQNKTPPLAAPLTGTGIAVDPNDSNTVIAIFSGGLGGGAVWVTTDGGTTWTDRSAGLPGNPMNAVVYDGTRLLVGGGQLFGSQYVGLYASTDLGATWTELDNGTWPVQVVTAIAVDPDNAQTILVATPGSGVNRTTDGGATWQIGVGGTSALAALSLRYAPGNTSELFLGATSLGVFRSDDGGDDFVSSGDGMSELSLFSVAASPLDSNAIAVAFQGQNSGGVFSSTDGGAHWLLEPVPPTRYSAVGYAPDGTLYAISSGPSSIAPEGLYRRNADGTWTGLGPDQGPAYESDLADMRFSVNNPDLILLGGSDFGNAGFGSTVWRSLDAGGTWVKVFLGTAFNFVTSIEIVEDGTDQTMVASYDDASGTNLAGALRSVDGGADWTPALTGLPSAFLRQPKLCASPTEVQTFFMSASNAGNQGMVFRTDDAAQSWSQTAWAGGGGIPSDIACDPVDDQVLYISEWGPPKVARSDDQGATFAPFDTGLDAAGGPTALAVAHVAGSDDTRLLLSTSHGSFATPTSMVSDRIFADGFESPPR
jgi:hypothetical protein